MIEKNMLGKNKHISILALVCTTALFLLSAQNTNSGTNAADHSINEFVYTSKAFRIQYRIQSQRKLLASVDRGATWKLISRGLPRQHVYPFKNEVSERISAVGCNPSAPEEVYIGIEGRIFYSDEMGSNWKEIKHSGMRPSAYIQAIAVSSQNPAHLVVGTSYHGLYQSSDSGKTWTAMKDNIPHIYMGAGFHQAVSAAGFFPEENSILIAMEYEKALYKYNFDTNEILQFPYEKDQTISNIFSRADTSLDHPGYFQFLLEDGIYTYDIGSGAYQKTAHKNDVKKQDRASLLRRQKAAGKVGMYLTSYQARPEYFSKHTGFAKKHGFNALVIDFKDDNGYITYDTALKLPREIGAARKRFSTGNIMNKAGKEGLYVIARLVIFKDRQLYQYKNNKYALWDKKTDKPWGRKVKVPGETEEDSRYEQREFWVDPYAEFVWDYNIDIAKELENAGVDEIQFDYIRFPSDGDTANIYYRYKNKHMRREDALESFLTKARKHINIPISTDVYGFNAWYRMNYLGQNINIFSDHVDVICPMFYPSHYPRTFLPGMTYLDWSERIYHEGTKRALQIADGRALIRPYVQAFLIGKELSFDTKTYVSYLDRQMIGAVKAGAAGALLWNASNRYYMVTKSMSGYDFKGVQNE